MKKKGFNLSRALLRPLRRGVEFVVCLARVVPPARILGLRPCDQNDLADIWHPQRLERGAGR
jgi:hypothetical protein